MTLRIFDDDEYYWPPMIRDLANRPEGNWYVNFGPYDIDDEKNRSIVIPGSRTAGRVSQPMFNRYTRLPDIAARVGLSNAVFDSLTEAKQKQIYATVEAQWRAIPWLPGRNPVLPTFAYTFTQSIDNANQVQHNLNILPTPTADEFLQDYEADPHLIRPFVSWLFLQHSYWIAEFGGSPDIPVEEHTYGIPPYPLQLMVRAKMLPDPLAEAVTPTMPTPIPNRPPPSGLFG